MKAVGVTMLALLFASMLSSPFTATVGGMFSSPERGDFRMTDLYMQAAEGRPVRQLEDRIIIVDIGRAGRAEIADALRVISFCDAAAVGLDVNFAAPGPDAAVDSTLIDAIYSMPNLVLPMGVAQADEKAEEFVVTDRPFFAEMADGLRFGVVNLPAEHENACIREFAVDYPMSDGMRIPSFVTSIAAAGGAECVDDMARRGNSRELIDYASREIEVMTFEDVEEHPERLNGKYVLVGSMEEAGDMHGTPISSYMSGVRIHAYSLSTLLDERWLAPTPKWLETLVAGVLCFIIIWLSLTIKSGAKGLMLRILQLLFLFFTVYVGYTLYIERGVICDFTKAIMMLAFGLFALDAWNGIEWIIAIITKKVTKKRRKKCASIY